MTTKEVSTMLGSLGIPTAYYQFPEPQEGPPFLCFFYQSNNDMLADDVNYVRIWSKDEEVLDDERMYEVVYEMDVIITEENNGQ